MKNIFLKGLITLFLSQIAGAYSYSLDNLYLKAYDTTNIISLFAVTADDIKSKTALYLEEAKNTINTIVAIPDDQRTFGNTAQPIDQVVALSNAAIARAVYHSLERLSPDEGVRNAAYDACITIDSFFVEQVTTNKKLYNALVAYIANNKDFEQLSDEQHYFITNTINNFKKEGLSLSDETLALVIALRKELIVLSSDFERNIAHDSRSISVTQEELIGLDNNFIQTLTQTSDGLYILGIDYPTYINVMNHCSVANTRKQLSKAFNNRAYPENDILLKAIMEKRDQLAHLLEYNDFAHLDIDNTMAHSPERVQEFITDIVEKSYAKVQSEVAIFTEELPESVELTENGQIQPWDFAFITNHYFRNHFSLNEHEYFPMEKTIAELFDIYRQFFSIEFQEVTANGLWHEDVHVIQVTDKNNNQLLGTLLLDLYPRPYKHNHPCEITIIPKSYTVDGTIIPNVSIVIANFTKPSISQPSLLTGDEVKTFFHEFGHALHEVLSTTTIASLSGTHTKTDFVELPSQMLEEWLTNKEILKKVSGHYITGQSLPDDIIDTMLKLKSLILGCSINQQAYFAQMSLSYFGSNPNYASSSLGTPSKENCKNPHAIMATLHKTIMPHIAWDEDNHLYASFGHLTGYGAKYYGYLWSKVFALDLFATIKQQGLLNPEIGQKYIKEVLSKGGAQDPNELLYHFLGREPNAQAFLQEMGLN